MRMLIALLLLAPMACSDDDETGSLSWDGADPHASLEGATDGHDLAVDVHGTAATAEVVSCKLKYTVPDPADQTTWAQGKLDEFEIAVRVIDGGIEKAYELEFVGEDFSTMADRRLAVPAEVSAEVSFEWEENATAVNVEQSATSGTLLFAELVGTPGADGKVIPAGAGRVGGAFQLTLPDGGTLEGSFSAPCTEVEVE